jgi:hypothetical protein
MPALRIGRIKSQVVKSLVIERRHWFISGQFIKGDSGDVHGATWKEQDSISRRMDERPYDSQSARILLCEGGPTPGAWWSPLFNREPKGYD